MKVVSDRKFGEPPMSPVRTRGLICIVAALYIYARWNFGTLEKLGIPVVEHHPLLGSVRQMYKEVGALNDIKWMHKYGQVFGVYEGRQPQIFICDPELVRLICIKDADYFNSKRQLEYGDPVLNEMPDFQTLEKWKLCRSFLTPAFSSAKIKAMNTPMREATTDYIADIKNSIKNSNKGILEKFAVDESLHTMLTDLITRCVFSIKINDRNDTDNEFSKIVKQLLTPSEDNQWLELVMWSHTFPILRKFVPAIFGNTGIQRFRTIFRQLMDDRRKSGVKKNDVVDMCVEWADQLDTPQMKKENVTELTIMCQALVFFFAGQDQMSTLVATTLYHIATNPEIAKKAYEEVDTVFKKCNGELDHEHIPELVYINACINESLRLYPFFYRTERVCTKDWKNEKHNLTIKKGTVIQFPIWAANRNPEFNEDPEKYDPERWMPENKHKINVYSSTSFGFGPRNCTGIRFATEGMPLVAAYMLRDFKFVIRKDSEIKFIPGGPFFQPHSPIYLDIMERTTGKSVSAQGWNFGVLEELGIPVVEHHHLLGSVKEVYGEPGGPNDTKWMKKYGPIFGVYEGRTPQIFVCDAELIRLICVKDANYFNGKRLLDFGDPLLNEMPEFQPRKSLKPSIVPSLQLPFTSAKIKMMNLPMREATKDYISDIKDTIKMSNKNGVYEKLAVDESIHTMLTDLFTRCAFSIRISGRNNVENEFAKLVRDLINPSEQIPNMTLIQWSHTFPFLRKFTSAPTFNPEVGHKFGKIFKQIMEQRRKSGEKKNDIVDICIEWADKLNTPEMKKFDITEVTILAQALVSFFAGQDQISTLVAITFYYVATNPEIAKKAYDEVDAVFKKHNGIIEHEHLNELLFVNACINESTRLYSFFHRMERICTKDWTNEKYGLHLKKGMVVIMPIWAANRNPEYNENPEKYDPERWMPENKDKLNVYSTTSFGHGPRNCTGMRFATEVMPLLTAYLLRNFKFVGRKDSEIKFKPGGPLFQPHEPIYLDIIDRALEN
ncbi:Cytochrome P450 3A40 [Orchesella cincta]|uniref:Cytochrome P450 3A40 n=1 Tax=Orchesella cincta TaxID=48709 RepID=A0A1D2MZC1_ORCCI|nr:Cytochrome P450 3A40 [Orchesella cincta]